MGIGVAASVNRNLMVLYFVVAFGYFVWKFVKEQDKFLYALLAAGYFTGAEVFLRMTKASPLWETGKYMVIGFSILGFLFIGFKKNAVPYIAYLLLLIPGIIVAYDELAFDLNFRKAVMFNISGPLALSIAAVFCFGRTISFSKFLKILDYIVYPLIAMTIYIILHTPSNRDIFTSAASNAAASGGYSGNQVSTVLGLGFFILLTRFFIPYKNLLVHGTMMLFMALMGYRALLTFSRGGVITGIACAVVFIGLYFFVVNVKKKAFITARVVLIVFGAVAMWGASEARTGGMITNRYTNKDSLGREKDDITTGRADLMEAEIDAFKTNPVFGLGVGRVKGYFEEELGNTVATHNEVSRMFSEHGLFGILALLTLIFAPIITKLQGRKNIYFYPFILFWLLTIMHSSMRIAVPAFIYALCLLNINYVSEKKISVRRQSVAKTRSVANNGRHPSEPLPEGRI